MRSQKLILYSLAAITIGLLAWNWSVDGEADATTTNAHKPVSPRLSTIKTRSTRLAGQPNSLLKPASIDVNARLRALYVKYPELVVELHESKPELVSRFKKLFPNPSNPNFGEASDFEPMILGDSPWDESAATEFLDINADRLTELRALIDALDSFEQIQPNGLGESLRLISISYGLNVKLGRLDSARELYASAQKLIDGEANVNLLQVSYSIGLSHLLRSYNLQFIVEQPDLVAQLESSTHSTLSYSQTIQGEFTGGIKMVYNLASRDSNGDLYLDMTDITDDSSDIHSKESTKKYVPLGVIEDSLARQTIDYIRYLKECEISDTYISGTEMEKEMATRLAGRKDLTPEDKQLAELTSIGRAYYYDAFREAQHLQILNNIAIDISLAQYKGEEWAGEPPIDYKTGKPIIWDKEKNLLETGIEGDNSTVPIPVIK